MEQSQRIGCQSRANSGRSLRAVKRIQKTFFFEPWTSVLEPFNGTVQTVESLVCAEAVQDVGDLAALQKPMDPVSSNLMEGHILKSQLIKQAFEGCALQNGFLLFG